MMNIICKNTLLSGDTILGGYQCNKGEGNLTRAIAESIHTPPVKDTTLIYLYSKCESI